MFTDNVNFRVNGRVLEHVIQAIRMLPMNTFEFQEPDKESLNVCYWRGFCQITPSLGTLAKAKVPEKATHIKEKFGQTYFVYRGNRYIVSSREKI